MCTDIFWTCRCETVDRANCAEETLRGKGDGKGTVLL